MSTPGVFSTRIKGLASRTKPLTTQLEDFDFHIKSLDTKIKMLDIHINTLITRGKIYLRVAGLFSSGVESLDKRGKFFIS